MPKEVLKPQSPESLKAVADQLDRLSSYLRSCAAELEVQKIGVLEMTHYDAITRGMKLVTAFTNAVRTATLNEVTNRGDFRADVPDLAGSKKRKRTG